MYEGPLSVLCDTHAIPILLFVGERGPCSKTDIYSSVGRNPNMPKKIDSLADSGLIELEPKGDGRATRILLTGKGARVVELLRDMEQAMSGL